MGDTLKAYYDGVVFVPFDSCALPKGEVVTLSVAHNAAARPPLEEKLAKFKRLTDELRELNKTEPLPPDFDDLLSCRVRFERNLDL